MSESGSELVGIARSIDAFFTAAEQASAAPAAADPAPPEVAEPIAAEVPDASISSVDADLGDVGHAGDALDKLEAALPAMAAEAAAVSAEAELEPAGEPEPDLAPTFLPEEEEVGAAPIEESFAAEPETSFEAPAAEESFEAPAAEESFAAPIEESFDAAADDAFDADEAVVADSATESFDFPDAAPVGDASEVQVEESFSAPIEDPFAAPLEPLDEAAADEVVVQSFEMPEVAAETPEIEAVETTDAAAAPVDDEAPTALQTAVAAFLGGDVAAAADVRSLSQAELDAHQLDPVAEAAESLMMSDQADAHALGAELLTEPVRVRVVDRLGVERVDERREAYHGMFNRIGEEMPPMLRDAISESTDRFARRVYCQALAAMGEVARPTIVAMATDPNGHLARNGVSLLVDLGGEGSEELVVSAIEHREPLVRREALLGMARLQAEDADKRVFRALNEDDERVREAAIIAAGQLKVERAVTPLTKMLDEASSHDDIIVLIRALGQIGEPSAVPSIEKHASAGLRWKRRTAVRIAAFQALHHIGTPHAMDLVKKAASDKDPEVQEAVLRLARSSHAESGEG